MSTEEKLVKRMEKLQLTLERGLDTANELLTDAAELGDEWEAEISTELMDITGRLGDLIEEYSNLLEEARIIKEGSVEEDSFDDFDE